MKAGTTIVAGLRRNRWWAARLLAFPMHTLLFAIGVFFLVRAIPGDPVITATNGQITDEQYQQARAQLGLSGTLVDQFGRYVDRIVHGDLGTSLVSGREVLPDLVQVLPETLELVGLGIVATAIVSSLLAYWLVSRPSNVISRFIRVYAGFAGAVPLFVFGVALIYVFVTVLHVAPAPLGLLDGGLTAPPRVTGFPFVDAMLSGRTDVVLSIAAHLALPVAALALDQSAMLTRVLAPALEEAAAAAPTRFRIACGVRRRDVVLSIFRRALPATVTMLGTMLGALIGGAVILEDAFSQGGMGRYITTAVATSDLPAIQGFLIVVAVVALAVFMVVDITNMCLDPRRRPGAQTVDAS